MNKQSKLLLITNLVTLICLGGLLIKEEYPQRIMAKFKKEEVQPETHKIAYWLNRQNIFEVLPRDSNSIVFLGTSLTENFELTELFHGCNFKNRGITADKTEGVLNRLSPIIADHPKKIFIEVGVNDIGKGVSREALLSNYGKILDTLQLKCPQAKLYVQSILPVSNTGTYPAYNNPKVNEEIRMVNKELKAMAESRKLTFIDLYDHFALNGELKQEYAIEDGIHFKGAAYLLWAELLKPYLAE